MCACGRLIYIYIYIYIYSLVTTNNNIKLQEGAQKNFHVVVCSHRP